MDAYNILMRILNGSTITTIQFNNAIIDKYENNPQKIDTEFVRLLHTMEFIEHDSGNLETGENHFLLNDKFITFKEKYKIVSISKIDKQMETYKRCNIWYISGNKQFEEFEKAYEKVKIKSIRKEKIKRINESTM